MTVMTYGNSEGTKRCDGRCHNATNPDCDCICGGRYHGAVHNGGLQRAMEEFEDGVLESARQRAKAEGWDIKIKTIADLFGQQTLGGAAL